jgi:hypothetical protein
MYKVTLGQKGLNLAEKCWQGLLYKEHLKENKNSAYLKNM